MKGKTMAKKVVKKKVKKAVRKSGGSQLDTFIRNGEPVRGFSNLPTGVYDGYIKAGSAVLEPKEGGGDRVTMFLVVTAPDDYKDREQRKRDDLSTQFGYNLFLGDLTNMEFAAPTSREELGQILSETDNKAVRFWVGQSSGEFPPKVRINELLEDQGGAPAEESDVWSAEDIAGLSEADKEALAKQNDINPDDFTWEELDEKLVGLPV
jgi:hypothetical protein